MSPVRSDAVKKIIASMIIGKGYSGLFPDVLRNMQTDGIELKELVYLYLMDHVKTQPELVFLMVIANVIIALTDIHEDSPEKHTFKVNENIMNVPSRVFVFLCITIN